MSDLTTSVNEASARPRTSAPKGVDQSGRSLPQEAAKEVRTDRSGTAQEAMQEDPQLNEEVVSKIRDFMQNEQRGLNFQLDEDSGMTVISVYDADTKELIRQIPSEEMLSLAQKLNDEEPSMLFSARV